MKLEGNFWHKILKTDYETGLEYFNNIQEGVVKDTIIKVFGEKLELGYVSHKLTKEEEIRIRNCISRLYRKYNIPKDKPYYYDKTLIEVTGMEKKVLDIYLYKFSDDVIIMDALKKAYGNNLDGVFNSDITYTTKEKRAILYIINVLKRKRGGVYCYSELCNIEDMFGLPKNIAILQILKNYRLGSTEYNYFVSLFGPDFSEYIDLVKMTNKEFSKLGQMIYFAKNDILLYEGKTLAEIIGITEEEMANYFDDDDYNHFSISAASLRKAFGENYDEVYTADLDESETDRLHVTISLMRKKLSYRWFNNHIDSEILSNSLAKVKEEYQSIVRQVLECNLSIEYIATTLNKPTEEVENLLISGLCELLMILNNDQELETRNCVARRIRNLV